MIPNMAMTPTHKNIEVNNLFKVLGTDVENEDDEMFTMEAEISKNSFPELSGQGFIRIDENCLPLRASRLPKSDMEAKPGTQRSKKQAKKTRKIDEKIEEAIDAMLKDLDDTFDAKSDLEKMQELGSEYLKSHPPKAAPDRLLRRRARIR